MVGTAPAAEQILIAQPFPGRKLPHDNRLQQGLVNLLAE